MIVKVKETIKYVDMWYNEVTGRKFYAWQNPSYPGFYFVDLQLFIPAEDVEVIKNER